MYSVNYNLPHQQCDSYKSKPVTPEVSFPNTVGFYKKDDSPHKLLIILFEKEQCPNPND